MLKETTKTFVHITLPIGPASSTAQGNTEPRQLPRRERSGPEDGLHHRLSEAKRLREVAKSLSKRVEREQARWEIGTSRMGEGEWRQLLDDSIAAWDKAEEVSFEAGSPFKDKNGNIQNSNRTDLTYIALTGWCRQVGVEYS